MGAQDGVGVGEIHCEHEFHPSYGVEQTAAQQGGAQVAQGEVLVEQQQVVAEVQIGFTRVGGGEAPSAEMVDPALRHGHNLVAVKEYAPAKVNLLHVGEE